MHSDRRTSVAALSAAGLLWGTTVPLSKLALEWLPPGWLTVARFGLAAAVLLATARSRARAACSPAVLAWGALGYGGSILVQNAGIERTSVSHAALLVGATPVLVAVIAAASHDLVARPVAWAGFVVSLTGVGLVAAGGGGGATFTGDALVLVSLGFSASFTVAQARLLPGRDPVAVTAVQFLAAVLATLPVAALTEGPPPLTGAPGALPATAGLVLLGTLAPSTLFAFGQARVSAETAGAFVNLEPLVGAAAGAVVFGEPVGLAQAAGGAAILTGIALSTLPLLQPKEPGDHPVLQHLPAAAAPPRRRRGRARRDPSASRPTSRGTRRQILGAWRFASSSPGRPSGWPRAADGILSGRTSAYCCCPTAARQSRPLPLLKPSNTAASLSLVCVVSRWSTPRRVSRIAKARSRSLRARSVSP